MTEKKFKLFFSGADTYYRVLARNNVKNYLISYYYVITRKFDMEKFLKIIPAGSTLMVDSGAHTLQKKEHLGFKYYDSFIEGYLKFLKEYKKYIYCAVELDIESVVGFDVVETWQKIYFQPFSLQEGLPIIYVWHDERGFDEWIRMCSKFNYLGLTPKYWLGYSYYNKFFLEAIKNNVKVHGFAITSQKILEKYPFFTADSTTWLVGKKFGEFEIFKSRTKKRISKHQRKYFYGYFMNKVFIDDWDSFIKEDEPLVHKANIYTFLKLEQFINEKFKFKQYWNK